MPFFIPICFGDAIQCEWCALIAYVHLSGAKQILKFYCKIKSKFETECVRIYINTEFIWRHSTSRSYRKVVGNASVGSHIVSIWKMTFWWKTKLNDKRSSVLIQCQGQAPTILSVKLDVKFATQWKNAQYKP